MPPQFPNVVDAVKDFQSSIQSVVREISVEYTRMFSNENEEAQDPKDSKTAIKSPITQKKDSSQLREFREQRKEKFLVEFNNSQRYHYLRLKLKKAIFRLAVEKYNKEVDFKGLPNQSQKEKFKAELYTFLQEQMKIFLNQAIECQQNSPNSSVHQDLYIAHQIKSEEAFRSL